MMTRTDEDLKDCLQLLRTGSLSFHAAARLLPRTVSEAATALYAFCRVADDLIDAHEGNSAALSDLQRRLDAIVAQRPYHDPVDRALAAIMAKHRLSRIPFDALLEGMAWDVEGRRYQTLDDVLAYSARVAASVGAMMAQVMGVRDASVLARACDLGLAMQLTNIARDVGQDAHAGRCYLPAQWFAQYGVDADAWLAQPGDPILVRSLVHRLLREAERLYRQGIAGISGLPLACRPGILAAALIYRDIGRGIDSGTVNPLTARMVTTTRRKFALLARAALCTALPAPRNARMLALPPAASVAFLVEACASNAPHAVHLPETTGTGIGDQLVAVLELFQRLEQRDRGGKTEQNQFAG